MCPFEPALISTTGVVTSSNDPLFYSHHSNVDRMWHLWSTTGGGQGFDDPDWLDTAFVFYDAGDDIDKPRKVRITFRDVVDTSRLGYTYEEDPKYGKDDLPWLKAEISSLNDAPSTSATTVPKIKTRSLFRRDLSKEMRFPLTLVQDQVVEVPGVAVPAKKKGKEQVLVIDGIEFDPQANNRFDIAINVPADKALQVGPRYKEYAGSFAVVPGSGAGTRQGKVSLCISEVLADIGAAGDRTVDVVIVPRTDGKIALNVSPTIKNRN